MAFTRAFAFASFVFVLVTVCAGVARAGSRMQLALMGEIAPDGGARIEIDVTFRTVEPERRPARIELGLHLAQKTTAAEIAALVEHEILRYGGSVLRTVDPRDGTATLFLDCASGIGLRLGRGLSAQVCTCEEGVGLVRFVAPKEVKEAARFTLSASSDHPQTHERTRFDLALDFSATMSGEQAADLLTTESIHKGWGAQWVNHTAWAVQSLPTSARATGACLKLETKGDWRIEIELGPEERAR